MFMHKYIYADVSLCPCMCMHSCVYSLCTGMFGHIYAQILLWTSSIRQTCTGTFKQRYTLCTSAFLPKIRHFSNKYLSIFIKKIILNTINFVYAQVWVCTCLFLHRCVYSSWFMHRYVYAQAFLCTDTFINK